MSWSSGALDECGNLWFFVELGGGDGEVVSRQLIVDQRHREVAAAGLVVVAVFRGQLYLLQVVELLQQVLT